MTIGEVVATGSSPYVPAQRCLLCEASAIVKSGESEAQIECAACGPYCASLDAARAMDALVKYRQPALAQMRQMIGAYRQSRPGEMPTIGVRYVVSAGVPTFHVTNRASRRAG